MTQPTTPSSLNRTRKKHRHIQNNTSFDNTDEDDIEIHLPTTQLDLLMNNQTDMSGIQHDRSQDSLPGSDSVDEDQQQHPEMDTQSDNDDKKQDSDLGNRYPADHT